MSNQQHKQDTSGRLLTLVNSKAVLPRAIHARMRNILVCSVVLLLVMNIVLVSYLHEARSTAHSAQMEIQALERVVQLHHKEIQKQKEMIQSVQEPIRRTEFEELPVPIAENIPVFEEKVDHLIPGSEDDLESILRTPVKIIPSDIPELLAEIHKLDSIEKQLKLRDETVNIFRKRLYAQQFPSNCSDPNVRFIICSLVIISYDYNSCFTVRRFFLWVWLPISPFCDVFDHGLSFWKNRYLLII